jgi:hypothetical protein
MTMRASVYTLLLSTAESLCGQHLFSRSGASARMTPDALCAILRNGRKRNDP